MRERTLPGPTSRRLVRFGYGLFTFVFAAITFGVTIVNVEYRYHVWLLLPGVVLYLLAAAALWRLLGAREVSLARLYRSLLPLMLLGMGTMQLLLGSFLRFSPIFDLEALFQGAIEWTETGTFTDYTYYYYIFPNNLGGMALLRLVFGVARLLGVSDYFWMATVFNSLMTLAAMAVSSLLCRRLFGPKGGIFCLLLFATSPPFYLMAPVFYTDSLTLLFPVLIVYLYCCLLERKGPAGRMGFTVLIGIAAAIGMLIKFTVVIALIAVLLHSLLTRRLRETLCLGGTAACIIALSFFLFNSMIYGRHLDSETAKSENTPYSHWIMMGLRGDGSYHNDDFLYTRSFDDPDERRDAVAAEIRNRLKENGVVGSIALAARKSLRCFGDSTLALSDFLDDRPESLGSLHEWVLYAGQHYIWYQTLCGIPFCSMLILLVLSGVQAIRSKTTDGFFVPQLALLGLLAFLLLWETSGRYILNFTPLMAVCAAEGMPLLADRVTAAVGKYKRVSVS